jgi:predicted nucleotidyltransferase
MQQPAEIFQRVRDTLEKVGFAFVEAAEAVSAEGLHDSDVDVGVVIAQEGFAIDGDKFFERAKIVIEKLLAEIAREIGFGVVEKRGDIVLEGAFAAALVVDEIGLAFAKHDVTRLKIAIEKIVARGAEKKIGEAAEILLESVLVERNARQSQKIIFEIVEVPGDGLAIKTGDGVADAVVEVAAGFDLKAREDGDDFLVGFDDLGRDDAALAILGEKFEERGVAEVFFEIGTAREIFGVDFGDGKMVLAKMFGEREEGGVFFADVVENADGGAGAGG